MVVHPSCYTLPVTPSDSVAPRQIVVSPTGSGMRLDRFLAEQWPELSRTRVQELIEEGHVSVDGKPARKGSLRLRGDENIVVEIHERPATAAKPESIPLEILYEDEDVIAINKPAGMTVHAGAGNVSGTLVNALLGRGLALSTGGHPLRPGGARWQGGDCHAASPPSTARSPPERDRSAVMAVMSSSVTHPARTRTGSG